MGQLWYPPFFYSAHIGLMEIRGGLFMISAIHVDSEKSSVDMALENESMYQGYTETVNCFIIDAIDCIKKNKKGRLIPLWLITYLIKNSINVEKHVIEKIVYIRAEK